MTLRKYTVTAGLCRYVRMNWNLRSVTDSKVSSEVPYRIAATWLIPDPTNVVCVSVRGLRRGMIDWL
jgi:hypothetical protein